MKKESLDIENLIDAIIIEDNRFIREGWELALKKESGFEIIGSYESCESAFKSESIGEADIVLMDIGLPGMSGIEGVKYLKERYPKIIIVMCTVHDDDEKIFDAICAGAVGYMLKKTSSKDLINALRDAYNGGSPMTPSVARKVITSFQGTTTKSFTGEIIKLTQR